MSGFSAYRRTFQGFASKACTTFSWIPVSAVHNALPFWYETDKTQQDPTARLAECHQISNGAVPDFRRSLRDDPTCFSHCLIKVTQPHFGTENSDNCIVQKALSCSSAWSVIPPNTTKAFTPEAARKEMHTSWICVSQAGAAFFWQARQSLSAKERHEVENCVTVDLDQASCIETCLLAGR